MPDRDFKKEVNTPEGAKVFDPIRRDVTRIVKKGEGLIIRPSENGGEGYPIEPNDAMVNWINEVARENLTHIPG